MKTKVDPELSLWLLEFITAQCSRAWGTGPNEGGPVSLGVAAREFFEGDTETALAHLRHLVRKDLIHSRSIKRERHWIPGARPKVAPNREISHTDCEHDGTPHAREKCRRALGVPRRGPKYESLLDGEVHIFGFADIQELYGVSVDTFRNGVRQSAGARGLSSSILTTSALVKLCAGPAPLKWTAKRGHRAWEPEDDE